MGAEEIIRALVNDAIAKCLDEGLDLNTFYRIFKEEGAKGGESVREIINRSLERTRKEHANS